MAYLYLVPQWFFGFGIAMEIIFGLIALWVALYAFKIFSFSSQRELKLFGSGFLLISISYFLWAIVNFFVLNQLDDHSWALNLGQITLLGKIGVYLHIIFYLAGLVTLLYMILRVKNVRAFFLILLLTFIAFFVSANKAFTFYILTIFFFGLIFFHYLQEYFSKKHSPRIISVLLAFMLLVISHISFLFSASSYGYYVVGHLIELAAYILILVSLMFSLKK